MEMGSEYYLELEDLNIKENTIFDYLNAYDSFYLDSGRSAIKFIVRNRDYDFVLLPEYICESVIQCFDTQKILFYQIDDQFNILLDSLQLEVLTSKKVIFYLMHYFGKTQDSYILEKIYYLSIKNKWFIIEDTTHSIFSEPLTIGDVAICSLRKWFPIEDGAVIYSKNKILKNKKFTKKVISFKSYAFILKTLYLRNQLDCNELYRKYFEDSEEALNYSNDIYIISDFSKFILKCIDITSIIQERKLNYLYLDAKIANTGLKKISYTPYIYIISLNERDEVRLYLNKNKFYFAVHWPIPEVKGLQITDHAKKLSNTLLSIPVDGRYTYADYDRLLECLANKGEINV